MKEENKIPKAVMAELAGMLVKLLEQSANINYETNVMHYIKKEKKR